MIKNVFVDDYRSRHCIDNITFKKLHVTLIEHLSLTYAKHFIATI